MKFCFQSMDCSDRNHIGVRRGITSRCSGGMKMVGGTPKLLAAAELGRYLASFQVLGRSFKAICHSSKVLWQARSLTL
jgi:hypothetical protein